jgi:hypothetical protein
MSERELMDEPEDAGEAVEAIDGSAADEEVAGGVADDLIDDPVDDPVSLTDDDWETEAPPAAERVEVILPGDGDDDLDEDGDIDEEVVDDGDDPLEERVRSLVRDVANAVEGQVSQVQAVLRDVVEQSRNAAEDVAGLVEREVRRQVDGLRATVVGDIERLEAKLDELGEAARTVRSARPGKRRARPAKVAAKKVAAKKVAASRKAPAQKAASRKATAKKAPAGKAAAKKAAGRKAAAKSAAGKKAAAKKTAGRKAASSTADRPNIWVTRDEADGTWAVRREGSPRRLGTFRTQAEAKTAGRQRAERDRVELIWQGRDGQIAGRAHYGADGGKR